MHGWDKIEDNGKWWRGGGGKGKALAKNGAGARVRNAGLKESEKTELILAPTWLVRSSGVCNAPRFNFGRTGT